MIRLIKTGFLSILLCLSLAAPSSAQDTSEGPYVQIRLVPERGTIKPGEEITIAIEQSIAEGWHTYWSNPGDSGAAPRVKWSLPEGFTEAKIEWPAPHKLPYGPLLNYGYENSVILLQKIKAPETLPEGPVTLKADIDILVCKEICIPESSTYELTLNTGAESEDNSAYFEPARSKLPLPTTSPSVFYEQDGMLVIEKSIEWARPLASYDYIPGDWGAVENASPSKITQENGKIVIRQKRGERPLAELKELPGLLLGTAENGGAVHAYAFTAAPQNAPTAATATAIQQPVPPAAPSYGLLSISLFAILGGLILNLMPCVFPVLSIKALSLVKIAEKQPALARLHGLSYTAGVIISFLLIAGLLIILKAGGAKIGWGFQLQSPEIVTLLAWLFFVIGLNLSGIFNIGGHFGNFGNRLTSGGSPGHSFFTGALATLVATPCTAPFMTVALGFALVQPAHISLLVFTALGFGLALPYLALSFIPTLQKILPRPGAWMETFRQFLAFPMYASAAWLIWVLSQQSGSMGVLAALMGLVLIAFSIWLLRHMPATKTRRTGIRILAVISFIVALMIIPGNTPHVPTEQPTAQSFGESWTPDKLAEMLKGDKPVFVEMTAAWCITCKVNHAVAINTMATRKAFADRGVQYLIGDWTNEDPAITEYLNMFGRNGVPIYVYYGPRDANGARPEPVLLPPILAPGSVAKLITAH